MHSANPINTSYRSLLAVLFFVLILTGASCKDLSTSDSTGSTTTTPEQAWAMYVEGWKEGNLEKILKACGPIPQAQKNCRETFDIIQKSDKKQFFSEALNKGKLVPDGENTGDIYAYYLYFNEEMIGHPAFENFKDLGWRLTEF